MNKEDLEKELEYIKSVIKDMQPNDGDKSFYCYQRDLIEEELKEIEKNAR